MLPDFRQSVTFVGFTSWSCYEQLLTWSRVWNRGGMIEAGKTELEKTQCQFAHHPTWTGRAWNRPCAPEPCRTPFWRRTFVQTVHKTSVHTSQRTQPVSIIKINQLTLCRTGISVDCGNHIKHTNVLCGQNTGHTQKNDAVVIVFTIKTAPFFCVYPVHSN